MRAIILAAGQGARLRPLTDSKPKCLVEYQGKPIVDHILETLGKCGISDIVVVKGYKEEVLQRDGVQYVVNSDFASTNMVETLFCAADYLEGDLLLSYGDIVYGPSVLRPLLESPHAISVAVDTDWRSLWEARMEDPLNDAETMKFNEKGEITELGKKPASFDDVEGQYMGLIKIAASAIDEVKEFYYALDRNQQYDGKTFPNMYMTSFLQLIIDRLMPVHATLVKGGWLEIDCPEDLQVKVELRS